MARIFISLLLLVLAGCTSQPLPANWAPLTTVMERSDLLAPQGVVTTVSPNLYVSDLDWFNEHYPENSLKHEALRRHECQHALEQEEYVGGATGWKRTARLVSWINKYLSDKAFRLEVEKRGYKAEILYFRSQGLMINQDHYARVLSGSTYSNMISYEEALEWVKAVLQGQA